MGERIAGFKGEFLWELDIPEAQLAALAEAIPAEQYGWRPVEGTRSVSEVLVHIATGNFGLLDMAGRRVPFAPYLALDSEGRERFLALIMTNRALEESVTAKADVVAMLVSSLSAVRDTFTRASIEELDAQGEFFGERTTVRRVYLRMLAHMHEHMGQLVGYVRAMGLPAPWPDPMQFVRRELSDLERSRAV